jgi:hypothetical protein
MSPRSFRISKSRLELRTTDFKFNSCCLIPACHNTWTFSWWLLETETSLSCLGLTMIMMRILRTLRSKGGESSEFQWHLLMPKHGAYTLSLTHSLGILFHFWSQTRSSLRWQTLLCFPCPLGIQKMLTGWVGRWIEWACRRAKGFKCMTEWKCWCMVTEEWMNLDWWVHQLGGHRIDGCRLVYKQMDRI